MRPCDRDGEVCPFCVGHQPPTCLCQGGDFIPHGDTRRAAALRLSGHQLIVRCMMAIGDHDTDGNVAEAAFNTKADLIGKHGQPDQDWIDREWSYQLPDYEDRKRQRAKYRTFDEEAAATPLGRYSLPPSYHMAMLESAAEALGYRVDFQKAIARRAARRDDEGASER